MANDGQSDSVAGPLLLAAGCVVLVLGMMVAIVAIKPLEYKPPVACAEESCAHEGTAPVAPEHEAPPPASGAHAPHGE